MALVASFTRNIRRLSHDGYIIFGVTFCKRKDCVCSRIVRVVGSETRLGKRSYPPNCVAQL
ncbi:MAG: hypothetical protein SGPRY_012628, partial [Prymnesium sp.]